MSSTLLTNFLSGQYSIANYRHNVVHQISRTDLSCITDTSYQLNNPPSLFLSVSEPECTFLPHVLYGLTRRPSSPNTSGKRNRGLLLLPGP